MSAIGIDDIEGALGVSQYEEVGEFPVEQGYVWTTCSSVENGNPLFWDAEVAAEVTGGPIAPPTMVSVWFRPHHCAPNRSTPGLPLQIHFDLKEGLGLPEAVMSDNTIVFYEPVRPGDRLSTRQILKSVSDEKTTKLGTGRFWVIDVEYNNQKGEIVAVESYTGFGYRRTESEVGKGPLLRFCTDRSPRATSFPTWPTRSRPPPSSSGRWQHATGDRCTTTRTSPSTATAPKTSSSTHRTSHRGSSATSPTGPGRSDAFSG